MRKAFALAVVALGCHEARPAPPVPPEPLPTQPATAPDLARGAYIAAISGCATCHERNFAGGLEVRMPNGGFVRMANITPDRDTGIGAWSDAQIAAAIRRGVRPDHTRLAQVMPYAYYNRMTDADVTSLIAYLRALPAVNLEVERSEGLGPPLEIVEVHGNVDRVEDARAHGEYLATLMHCEACHTPRRGAFANRAFAGGTRFADVVSSNITPDTDTGIGTWSDEDIVRAVREMKDNTGQSLRPPMANYRDSYSKLTDVDAHALVFYLRSVPEQP
jgi:mono/diheme cytochrome c family protein